MATGNRDLEGLLGTPREAIDVEIKSWLDFANNDVRAKVGKTINALANSGGGYVLFGFKEMADGQFDPEAQPDGARITQDIIQDIVERYLQPTFQCTLNYAFSRAHGAELPVLVVPGGHRVPVKMKAGSPNNKIRVGQVFVRRPGPKSEEPQTAAEWDQLFERCIRSRTDELLDIMRSVIAGSVPQAGGEQAPSAAAEFNRFVTEARDFWSERVAATPDRATPRFPHGYYEMSAQIEPPLEARPLDAFNGVFRSALRNHSGWPPFPYLDREVYRPRPRAGAIEAWIGPDDQGHFDRPVHSDFWRAAPSGQFYTRFGFAEDGRLQGVAPGTTWDLTNPIWRVGETLLQLSYVCEALGASDRTLRFQLQLTGLAGRELVSVGNPNRILSPAARRSLDNNYFKAIILRIKDIAATLPEIVHDLLAPAYSLFDFFQLPMPVVQQELQRLRREEFGM